MAADPIRPMPDHQLEAFRRDPRDCSASEVMQLVAEIDRLRAERLSEVQASWHDTADETPSGDPARWSAPINAIVSDSGQWARWPEFGPEGWWNVRVAQSALQNLYRSGFAVVAVTEQARELIERDEPETTDG